MSPVPKLSRVVLRKSAGFFSLFFFCLFPLPAVNFTFFCLIFLKFILTIFKNLLASPFLLFLSFIVILGEFWKVADRNSYIQFTKCRRWSKSLFLIYQKPCISCGYISRLIMMLGKKNTENKSVQVLKDNSAPKSISFNV